MYLLAQNDGGGGGIIGMLSSLIVLALIVAAFAGAWKVFVKAGKPGWASIIPIYQIIVLLEIVGRPIWWIILMFVPCVQFVVAILLLIDLAKSFGKGAGYGIGLAFLPMIFFPLLGFGADRYLGPAAAQN